uniref:Uncharacterized protein n=1 Tax=Heterorhabditis bacteriophora TaxID=37862 RepID=A0A1I7XVS3_HETBA
MSSIYDEHEEEPQTTDNSVKKPPPNTVVLMPRRMPQSLHEARVIANSVRVAPGRYRVMSPPYWGNLFFLQLNFRRLLSFCQIGKNDGKLRFCLKKLVKFYGLVQYRVFRVYFPDDDETCEEHSPKKLRVIKRVDLGRYKKFEDTNPSNCSSKEDNQSHSHVLPRTEDGELGKPMLEEHGDYVEEVVDVMDEDWCVCNV